LGAQTPTLESERTSTASSASHSSSGFKSFKEAYKAGNQAFKDHQWSAAADDYSQGASLALSDKAKSQALNSQGWIFIKQKKWKAAQAVLNQAVQTDASNKTAEKNLGIASYRIYEYGLGGVDDLKTAITHLEAGGDTDLVELAKGDQTREETFTQTTPSPLPDEKGLSFKSLVALGNKCQAEGQFDMALKIFKKAGLEARSALSKGNAANLQGLVLLEARRPHESIPYFEEAVKDQPNEKVYLNNLGYGYWMFYDSGKGNEETLQKAVDAFYKANAIDPSFHKDNLLMALGELKEADPDAAKHYSASNEKSEEAANGESSAEGATPSPSSPDSRDLKSQGEDEDKDMK
jgi:tetratricopeptide (TPR) repeat protein